MWIGEGGEMVDVDQKFEGLGVVPIGAGVYRVPLDLIVPNSYQPRNEFDVVESWQLAESIRKTGVLQPITITEYLAGGFVIVAGERRYRAAKAIGLEWIPAVVVGASAFRSRDGDEVLKVAIMENVQRRGHNSVTTVRQLMGLVQDALGVESIEEMLRLLKRETRQKTLVVDAERVRRAVGILADLGLNVESFVTYARSLHRIPRDLVKYLEMEQLTPSAAFEIAREPDVRRRERLVAKVLELRLSKREIRKLVRAGDEVEGGPVVKPAAARGAESLIAAAAGVRRLSRQLGKRRVVADSQTTRVIEEKLIALDSLLKRLSEGARVRSSG